MSPSVEPFNEAKYKALMDGLEATEISLTTIKATTYDFRIESEFYKKSYIKILKHLKSINSKELKKGFSAFVTDGTHYTPDYVDEGVAFLSALNVQDNFFDVDAGYKYISVEQHRELSRRVLPQAGDVLLRKVGVGPRKACVIPQNAFEFSIFVSVALIRSQIDPYYLSTFINSKYGQIQLIRFNKGISQPDLHLEDINIMLVPEFSPSFYDSIRTLVLSSEQSRVQSQFCYSSAETMLDSTFNKNALENQKPSVVIKSFAKSFSVSGRLDAEYYQPQYDEYVLSLCTNDTVGSICQIHDKGYLPDEKQEYRYIELANVGISGEISNVETIIGDNLPSRARRKVKTGQVIISSVEGSLQSCALITDEYDNALCSTGFYVLTSESINPETLLVLFKSKPIQALMKQRCSGTILTAITKEELLSMPLPKIDDTVQKKVATKVQESFALRRQSEQLLEYAKQTVEMAIEQGEEKAIEWLKGKNVEV